MRSIALLLVLAGLGVGQAKATIWAKELTFPATTIAASGYITSSAEPCAACDHIALWLAGKSASGTISARLSAYGLTYEAHAWSGAMASVRDSLSSIPVTTTNKVHGVLVPRFYSGQIQPFPWLAPYVAARVYNTGSAEMQNVKVWMVCKR